MFSIVSFLSCSEKHEWNDNEDPEKLLQYVDDGALLSGMNVYCIPFKHQNIYDLGFESYTEFYESVKTVADISEFYFDIAFDCKNRPLHLTDKDEDSALQSRLHDYLYKKGDYIRKDKEKHSDNSESIATIPYYSAYIDGGVEITCDKTLFGLQPGENLMDHLQIFYDYACQPYGISEPFGFFHLNQLQSDTRNTVFCNEAWLRHKYRLKFKGIPDEQYKEIRFSFKFPLIVEYASSYIASSIKGYEFHERFSNVIYESQVTVKFEQ